MTTAPYTRAEEVAHLLEIWLNTHDMEKHALFREAVALLRAPQQQAEPGLGREFADLGARYEDEDIDVIAEALEIAKRYAAPPPPQQQAEPVGWILTHGDGAPVHLEAARGWQIEPVLYAAPTAEHKEGE